MLIGLQTICKRNWRNKGECQRVFFDEETDMHFYLNKYVNIDCGLLRAYAGLDNVCVHVGKDRVKKLHSDLVKNLLTVTS